MHVKHNINHFICVGIILRDYMICTTQHLTPGAKPEHQRRWGLRPETNENLGAQPFFSFLQFLETNKLLTLSNCKIHTYLKKSNQTTNAFVSMCIKLNSMSIT